MGSNRASQHKNDNMKITLKNVSYSAALSEETAAFSAIVCADGTPFATVSNHGTGGGNEWHSIYNRSTNTADHETFDRVKAAVDAYADTLPAIECPQFPRNKDGSVWSYKADADSLVDDALSDWIAERDLKRRMKAKEVLFKDPSTGGFVSFDILAPEVRLDLWKKGEHIYTRKRRVVAA